MSLFVVIVGPYQCGKSIIFNALLRKQADKMRRDIEVREFEVKDKQSLKRLRYEKAS